MQRWVQFKAERGCGRCGTRFPPGTPLMELSRHGHKWHLVRCADCWGSPAPPELPAQIETQTESGVMQRLNEILRLLPFPERA